MSALGRNTLCSDALVDILKYLEVEIIFSITGAGNLAILDALTRDASIKIVYSHHEQAAVMEAQGYSRVTGKIGVALVTTGGGTSNTLTGLLSAYLDSIPILLISGNESSYHCQNENHLRAYGVQGFDSNKVFESVTKKSVRLDYPENIKVLIKSLVAIALSDRKGPVHIDIPMDFQRKKIDVISLPEEDEEHSSNLVKLNDRSISELVSNLAKAESPILYIGNGCRDPKTLVVLTKLISELQLPFILSWSAIDLYPDSHPLNIGRSGIYGERATNILLQRADLLICIGTRLSIPQIGYNKLDFARKAKKWIFEIDESECHKFDGLGWNVCKLDAFSAITTILEKTMGVNYKNSGTWRDVIEEVKNVFPKLQTAIATQDIGDEYIHSVSAIQVINEMKLPNSTIITDVGAGLLSGHYALESHEGDRIFTSQGLGEMGFGLPAAIGAYFADKERQLICLNTDGGIMFNLQELQLIKEHSIPIKLFIFNNLGYSMIKISQENLFDKRLSGSTVQSGISFPSFKDLAHTFSLNYFAVSSIAQLRQLFPTINSGTSAVLIEIVMDPTQRYLPRLGTSKTSSGDLVSPPLEDLDPLINIETLEKYLGYRAHIDSYRARNVEFPSG
jgi:acetolactate synthase-1/2/3 large subunit